MNDICILSCRPGSASKLSIHEKIDMTTIELHGPFQTKLKLTQLLKY
jgi:hypothetical protein